MHTSTIFLLYNNGTSSEVLLAVEYTPYTFLKESTMKKITLTSLRNTLIQQICSITATTCFRLFARHCFEEDKYVLIYGFDMNTNTVKEQLTFDDSGMR